MYIMHGRKNSCQLDNVVSNLKIFITCLIAGMLNWGGGGKQCMVVGCRFMTFEDSLALIPRKMWMLCYHGIWDFAQVIKLTEIILNYIDGPKLITWALKSKEISLAGYKWYVAEKDIKRIPMMRKLYVSLLLYKAHVQW